MRRAVPWLAAGLAAVGTQGAAPAAAARRKASPDCDCFSYTGPTAAAAR